MLFSCQECGRKFRTVKAAESAVRNGCPGCGGCDVDLFRVKTVKPTAVDPGRAAMMRDFDRSRRVED